MMKANEWSRRRWLSSLGAAGAGIAFARRAAAQESAPSPAPAEAPLALKDYQPKSMLHVPETKVARSLFPAIDMHTHLSWTKTSSGGVSRGEEMNFLARPEELIAVMDRKNVRMMVNLTGGTGAGLLSSIRTFEGAYPGRFATSPSLRTGRSRTSASRRSRPTPSSRRKTPARAA